MNRQDYEVQIKESLEKPDTRSYYRAQIIEKISQIENERYLRKIYVFVNEFTKIGN